MMNLTCHNYHHTIDTTYLYWGFCKKSWVLFRHPPALLLSPSPCTQEPKSWDSFQVLLNENSDVLIRRQIDISENWVRELSNGILNVKKN